MKIYIFGSNKETFSSKSKNALFVGDENSLEDALERFQICVDRVEYYNCYLVVDFETGVGRKKFHSTTITEDNDDYLPFFIVADWNLSKGRSLKEYVRRDHTEIISNGFVHEFQNNLSALEFFLYCTYSAGRGKNQEDVAFNIIYSRTENNEKGDSYDKRITRKIASSREVRSIISREKRSKPISKFRLSKLDWCKVQLSSRSFYNCDLKKMREVEPKKQEA